MLAAGTDDLSGEGGIGRMHAIGSLLAGPFAGRRSLPAAAGLVLLVVVLTALTQIGGVVLWFACGIGALAGAWRGTVTAIAFAAGYALLTMAFVPLAASLSGRVPLTCLEVGKAPFAAVSPLYCVLNRNYVRPATRDALKRIAGAVAKAAPGASVAYLDGGFPFAGLPLLPHLSHGDGRRLDIALFYEGEAAGGAWAIGYWAFAPSRRLETASACAADGALRWEMAFLQPLFAGVALDRARSAALLRAAADDPAVTRVFVEPYLAEALGVASPKLGFAGCGAARHDDHIHISVE